MKGKKTTRCVKFTSITLQPTPVLWTHLMEPLRFVDYAMHRVRLLRHHGITPYIVFDGGPLPAKKGTENSRAKWVETSTLRVSICHVVGPATVTIRISQLISCRSADRERKV